MQPCAWLFGLQPEVTAVYTMTDEVDESHRLPHWHEELPEIGTGVGTVVLAKSNPLDPG